MRPIKITLFDTVQTLSLSLRPLLHSPQSIPLTQTSLKLIYANTPLLCPSVEANGGPSTSNLTQAYSHHPTNSSQIAWSSSKAGQFRLTLRFWQISDWTCCPPSISNHLLLYYYSLCRFHLFLLSPFSLFHLIFLLQKSQIKLKKKARPMKPAAERVQQTSTNVNDRSKNCSRLAGDASSLN